MLRNRKRAAAVGMTTGTLLAATLVAMPTEASARPAACNTGTVICVNKSTRQLALVVNGRTAIVMSARFGSVSRGLPTREGLFRVYWKNRNHVSSLYGTAMPFAMFFSGGQAIHYSSDFARNGYNGASHGCINTRDYAATQALFNAAPTGTKVYIHW
ncbi:L,D-transpeptidase [Sporichthya polymorpha]|uniref:L,D-transpeptidase n=1 Tax=Sporichthya polymorpha TaxID=35751 RepID=UPI0012EB417D|nr:L,D-transpeptidase [Sporichthya polymorpha]